jgi:hypothetical protein
LAKISFLHTAEAGKKKRFAEPFPKSLTQMIVPAGFAK